jgi:hypothetical protein
VDVDLSGKVIAAFQPWLQQHARQLVSLTASRHIYGAVPPQLRLPCADLVSLTRLELEQKALVLDGLDSNSTAAGVGRMQLRWGPQPQLLPKLRLLKLARCNLDSVETLLQFSVLTSLTGLQLKHTYLNSSSSSQQAQQDMVFSNALCTLLAQLQQLEDVLLSSDQLSGSSLSSVVQQLSSLRQLRSAHIDIPQSAARTDNLLSALPRGLTGLTVWDWRRNPDLDNLVPSHPATFPQQMPQLSDLQELHLESAVFHPGMLSVMKRLQCLRLRSCTLLPYCPEWEDAAAADAAASAAMSAFLAAVGGMTDLVSLVIQDDGFCYETRGWEAAPAAAFRALTASSKLQELVVQADNELPLPWGAVQHVFPAGRVLPHLTQLTLEAICSSGEPLLNRRGRPAFMSAQHLRDVVRACPALVELHICYACASHDLTPLCCCCPSLSPSCHWVGAPWTIIQPLLLHS